MILSDTSVADLKWWIKNVESSFKAVSHGDPTLSLYSDASKEGWGGGQCAMEIGQEVDGLQLSLTATSMN